MARLVAVVFGSFHESPRHSTAITTYYPGSRAGSNGRCNTLPNRLVP